MRKRPAVFIIAAYVLILATSLDVAAVRPSDAATNPVTPERGRTLAAIKARGTVRCGASAALEGFGEIDAQGKWSGFDIDFCRAIAAAIFGDASRVEFVPLTAAERFEAIASGKVDVLNRNTTWTLSRETGHGLLFTGVTYYDGQGFLVRRSLAVTSALSLASDTICVQRDTTTELNLADFFRQRGQKYKPIAFATAEEVENAYKSGACGAYTTDASALFVLRASLPHPEDNIILPEIIAKEPLGPSVRQGDDQWFSIVRWTLIAMIDAEEMGITQANVDAMVKNDNPRVKRLLGAEGNFGQPLGLTSDWAYRIIKFVGNYDDVFERNLGSGSKLKIKRGLNALWTHGGLLYAPPIL
jgi:general L-amino acid transport system substrate-binding protein